MENEKQNQTLRGLKIANVDADEINNGVWSTFHGVELKIARYNNNNYVKRYLDAFKQQLNADDSVVYALAGAVLTDWRGFKILDDTGAEMVVEYSVENALELLQNDPITLDYVTRFCRTDSNYISAGLPQLKKK